MRKLLSRIGRVIDALGRWVARLLFVFLVVVVLITLFSSPSPPRVPSQAALVIAPSGNIIEQQSLTTPADVLLGAGAPRDTLLQEVLQALELAAGDERIAALVLDVSELAGIGPAHLETLGDALQRFRERSGKPVYAWGEYFSQGSYGLVSHADHVMLHPMGNVMIQGYGGNQLFFRDLLDRLKVNMHVFRAGEFKAAAEPFTRMDFSDEARADNQALLDDLWARYKSRVASNRALADQDVQSYADNFASLLSSTEGNMARLALEQGLIDDLVDANGFHQQVAAQVGMENGDFRQIDYRDYLWATQGPQLPTTEQVGIIVAQGTILPGTQPRGLIGSDNVVELLQQAQQNDAVKAVVLRIDSPGGSAMASEEIRAAMVQLQRSGKPVVVSMGGTAASGGYWISSSADQIWASPVTVTGSIGVIAMMPTFEEAVQDLGIGVDGMGTTVMSRAGDPLSGLDEQMQAVLQATVNDTYRRFLGLVADGRGMSLTEVEALAGGRVWSGNRARELGLVDELGELQDATAAAADLAGLSDWQAVYLERPLSYGEQLLVQMLDSTGATQALANWVPQAWQRLISAGPLASLSTLRASELKHWQSLIDLIWPANTTSQRPRLLMLCESCLGTK